MFFFELEFFLGCLFDTLRPAVKGLHPYLAFQGVSFFLREIIMYFVAGHCRTRLGDLLTSRESIVIQTRAVQLAQKRVNMTKLFLEAGRAQIRDLLEAESSLLSAQNSLTSAVANYRIAELELQRDMGVLKVDAMGLWQEYVPKETI